MCPACLKRRTWPPALMRSADGVPINYTGFAARPRYRVLPILGHEPNFPSAPFTLAIRQSPLSLTLPRQSTNSYTAPALSSPPRRYGRVCWRAPRKPTGTGGGPATREPRQKVDRACPIGDASRLSHQLSAVGVSTGRPALIFGRVSVFRRWSVAAGPAQSRRRVLGRI